MQMRHQIIQYAYNPSQMCNHKPKHVIKTGSKVLFEFIDLFESKGFTESSRICFITPKIKCNLVNSHKKEKLQVFRNNMLCKSDMNKPLSKNLENIDRNKKWRGVVLEKWRYLAQSVKINLREKKKEELPLAVKFP